jgi:DNA processing protein
MVLLTFLHSRLITPSHFSITFLNIDMSDNTHLSLAYLLQSWYTHHDLKWIISSSASPWEIWEDTKQWKNPLELSEDRIIRIREKIEKVEEEKIEKYLERKEIKIISIEDPDYPEKLKSIGHAPAFLYVRGHLRTDMPLLGVVGSRKHTPYAERILEKILPDIIQAGVWIISGGATGVDTMGHDITIRNHGYTIAVFGTGIDRCYPANNKKLFESILESGWALISHFPLETWPELYNFPIRNEIVAALSSGILIPEAGLSSGTLITAQLALEHGRDVFAVPWDIDRTTSEWTNMLISSGQGKCVRCSWDILEEYFDLSSIWSGMTPIVKISPVFTDEKESLVYEYIEKWSTTVDILLRETDLDMTELLMTIAMLEIGGHIRMDEMGRYQIV